MQLRGIPSYTAFTASIAGRTGLWYIGFHPSNAHVGRISMSTPLEVLALDVQGLPPLPFATPMRFRADQDVIDYSGPLDLRLKVRGYSPKRHGQTAMTHVLVSGEKERKLDRGPRAIHLREE